MEKTIRITNSVEQLKVLAQKVEELGEEWQLGMALVTNINLVLEEAVSNIIFYAFDDKKRHNIDITITMDNKKLTIQIVDGGKPFDPTKKTPPDTTLSAEEREIGGLGIFLMGKIMDKLDYQRKDEKNILTLRKTI